MGKQWHIGECEREFLHLLKATHEGETTREAKSTKMQGHKHLSPNFTSQDLKNKSQLFRQLYSCHRLWRIQNRGETHLNTLKKKVKWCEIKMEVTENDMHVLKRLAFVLHVLASGVWR